MYAKSSDGKGATSGQKKAMSVAKAKRNAVDKKYIGAITEADKQARGPKGSLGLNPFSSDTKKKWATVDKLETNWKIASDKANTTYGNELRKISNVRTTHSDQKNITPIHRKTIGKSPSNIKQKGK